MGNTGCEGMMSENKDAGRDEDMAALTVQVEFQVMVYQGEEAKLLATALTAAEQRGYERGKAEAPQWQPIETAPTGNRVLLWDNGAMRFAINDFLGNWLSTYRGPIKGPPTHWMPLPAAPSPGKPEGK